MRPQEECGLYGCASIRGFRDYLDQNGSSAIFGTVILDSVRKILTLMLEPVEG